MKFNGRELSVKESNEITQIILDGPNFLDAIKENTDEEVMNMYFIIDSLKRDLGVTLDETDVYHIFQKQNPDSTFIELHRFGHKPEEPEVEYGWEPLTKEIEVENVEEIEENVVKNTTELLNERERQAEQSSSKKRAEVEARLNLLEKTEKEEKRKKDGKVKKRNQEVAKSDRIKEIKDKKGFPNIFGAIIGKFIKPIDKDEDYYADLGVKIGTKSSNIENAYLLDKDMRMSFHNPERKDKENIESFKKTKTAYKILKHKGSRDWYILNSRVNNEEIDKETLNAAYEGRMFIRKLPKRILIASLVLGITSSSIYAGYANKDKIGDLYKRLFDNKNKTFTYDDNEVQAMAGNLDTQINASTLTDNQAYNANEGTNDAVYNGGSLNSNNPEVQTLNATGTTTGSANGYETDILTEEYYFLDANDEVQVYLRADAINKYLQASNVHSFTDDEIADAIKYLNGSYTPKSVDELYDVKENTKRILENYGLSTSQAANFAGGLVDENGVHIALGLNAFLVDNSEHQEFMDEAATLFIKVLITDNKEDKENACIQFFNLMVDLMEGKRTDANGDALSYEGLTPGEGFIFGVMTHMAFPVIDSAIPTYAVALKDNLGQSVLFDLMLLEYYYNPQCQEDIDLSNIEDEALRERLAKSINENAFAKHEQALINAAAFKLRYTDANGDKKELKVKF